MVSWEKYISDIEDGLMISCYKTALKYGYTIELADVCDSGILNCPDEIDAQESFYTLGLR